VYAENAALTFVLFPVKLISSVSHYARALQAESKEEAEEGARFMQEMIDLPKTSKTEGRNFICITNLM
jgi:hypothetical protein